MFNNKKIKIKGKDAPKISIERDDNGVIHVNANNVNDALWGSGYAHAIDRYTQLLLMRIIGQGRLCELLEDSIENLAIDTFFRRANWCGYLNDEVRKLDQATLTSCQRYCDGINTGLSNKKASMLNLLGYRYTPWTIEDSILLSRMTGYLTLAQSQAEVEHLFVETVQGGLCLGKLKELFPINESLFDRDLLESVTLNERIVPNSALWNNAIPRMMASNNWVISGDKTKDGGAILANDPHLEVNRLPNVWCEQSLNFDGETIKGMGMPGLPGIIIGRNNNTAWGATYAFMDTVDSWVEQCENGQFRYEGKWLAFSERNEVVLRKKKPAVKLTFYDNHHGVLAGDPHKNGNYLATRWTGADSGAKTLKASIDMLFVDNTKDAMNVLGDVESAWNWVIADVKGNIGYQMSGLMPKRHDDWNGFSPAPGWKAEYDWQGIVTPMDLPRCYNPSEGFIVTANNDLNHLGRVSPINMPMGDYRAKRIAQVIKQQDLHTIQSSQELQFDVYSHQTKDFLGVLLPLLEIKRPTSQAYLTLKVWDCRYDLESIGAPIFEAFYQALRHEVFGTSERGFGSDIVKYLTTDTGLFIDFYQQFDKIMLDCNSNWYQKNSRDECFVKALDNIESSSAPKKWRDINTIDFVNILMGNKLPAWMKFGAKGIPLLGGRATPHQGQIYRSDGRETSFSPTVRTVCTMQDNYLHTCLAGGPSDNPLSKWYRSSLKDWQQGNYKKL